MGTKTNLGKVVAIKESDYESLYNDGRITKTIDGSSVTLSYSDSDLYLVEPENAIGGPTTPMYLNVSSTGVPSYTACDKYAGGTAVTLNNVGKAAGDASFYAPTTGGTSGYFLKGNGTTSTPTWVDPTSAKLASNITTNTTLKGFYYITGSTTAYTSMSGTLSRSTSGYYSSVRIGNVYILSMSITYAPSTVNTMLFVPIRPYLPSTVTSATILPPQVTPVRTSCVQSSQFVFASMASATQSSYTFGGTVPVSLTLSSGTLTARDSIGSMTATSSTEVYAVIGCGYATVSGFKLQVIAIV